jgi:hypothetical protein
MADSVYQVDINPAEERSLYLQTYLFNESYFMQKQPCREVYTFHLVHVASKEVHARFSLFRQADKAISPCRGTFGSIEMNARLPVQYLDFFIREIDAFAMKQRMKQIEIKSYPFCYDQQVSATLTNSLLRQGYHLLHTELNYHLPVTTKAFTDNLHHSGKRRLQKCIYNGFTCGEEKKPDFSAIYQMIVQNRERKGHPVSMNFADFRQLFSDFPGIYKIFAVRDRSRVVAVTVAVEINKRILYYFLPAHDEAYNTYSPMVLLIQCLYNYCQQMGFTLFDLGISTDKGVPNYGLMRFKQNMGADASLKLSFVKNLVGD